VGTITLYPNPIAGGTLSQVCQEYTPTVQPGQSVLPLPSVLQDAFTDYMLGEARGKESDYALPDIADHCRARWQMYMRVAEHLWGPGQ
jgi:hypothetical protein